MKITHEKQPGYTLNVAHTTKFKTVKIQLVFSRLFQRDDVTARAMIPYLLRAVSASYPTRRDIQIKLESMYGASFQSGVKKTGLAQELTFDITFIHNDFAIDQTNLLDSVVAFLGDIIFHPRFEQTIFDEEKRLLEEYFISIYDNKMRYSFQEIRKAMFFDDLYQLEALGVAEDLETLRLEDVIHAYDNMLRQDAISISVVGDVNVDYMTRLIDTYFPFSSRMIDLMPIDYSRAKRIQPQHLVETQSVKQAKLVWGYQWPIHYLEPDYYAAIVGSMMLGGHAESILFKRIREELNKVYFIGSSYDQYKGSLYVYAGINELDYDEVQTEINAIVSSIQKGDFTDEILHITKTILISNFYQSLDSSSSICSRIHHLALFHRTFNPEELIAKIKSVSKADITRIASQLQLDTTFLLRGESHD
ncbi:EF-P 5-aminopentanol modification-associated protein YfmF [Candidatus Xianfuyuplasma coldseepsis]|uniref:Insulinase family protein n=1 Tax=Candidatus Xianfuyuplasma coldseepsis TaxID=2782163 RepID=A0A7L7KU53_9MOLU|nr:pitrilysin family protein [Xianfuyuplasma coldseepsis]QMS85832.1 insulinase family protein [Xianfuyuplasma coldseepsis]